MLGRATPTGARQTWCRKPSEPGWHRSWRREPSAGLAKLGRGSAQPPRTLRPRVAPQPYAIGYFAKISSIRLNALSAAACGVALS